MIQRIRVIIREDRACIDTGPRCVIRVDRASGWALAEALSVVAIVVFRTLFGAGVIDRLCECTVGACFRAVPSRIVGEILHCDVGALVYAFFCC